MPNNENNPLLSYAYALNGMTLAVNMMMLTAFYAEKEDDFLPFLALQKSFSKLDACIQAVANPEIKGNIQDIHIYGEKFLADYKAFKNLPEVQDEYLQKTLVMGIDEINKLLDIEEKYKEYLNR